MANDTNATVFVGPILQAGAIADAVIAAIREGNPETTVANRGSYLRVQAPSPCHLRLEHIERRLGRTFSLPGDLEAIMVSFAGKLSFTDTQVIWQAPEVGRR